MKVIKVYDQLRRDCTADLKCEECGKTTNDIKPETKQTVSTKYPEGFQV